MTQKKNKDITETPWDSKAFGMKTFEIRTLSKEVIEKAVKMKGHFTFKANPLHSKKLLHDYGFYYCDTLIEPYCPREAFVSFKHDDIRFVSDINVENLADMSNYEFFHGRFHRDFNINKDLADLRYAEWLKELYRSGNVFGFLFKKDVAGFFGFKANKILLHAINKKYKGKGLAKYFWSLACKELFSKGYAELTSSISASNCAAVNLYISLGFKFRHPVDVYHRFVK